METNKLTVLTKEDITKAENCLLSIKQLNFLFAETPSKHIHKRPGRGGQTWEYVTGVYIEKVLNLMFGFNWDHQIKSFDVNHEAKQCIVLGTLTVRTENHTIIKEQFGKSDIKYLKDKPKTLENTLDLGNDLKAAATDSLKKCASKLGIASDIYGKNEFKAIKIVESKPSNEQLILLEDLIEQIGLNDTEIQRIKFTLPTDSMVDVSKKIEGLKEMLDEKTPISSQKNHLDRILKK